MEQIWNARLVVMQTITVSLLLLTILILWTVGTANAPAPTGGTGFLLIRTHPTDKGRSAIANIDMQMVEAGIRMMLHGIGLDPENDPHLQDTPTRAARAWTNELCAGLSQPKPRITRFPTKGEDTDGMIILRNIPVKSLCAHHLLPFVGTAVVGYIPADRQLLGLSKLSRIVNYWARRPQVQERLTKQIADDLWNLTAPNPKRRISEPDRTGGVGVVIKADHFCMNLRGVNHPGEAVTSELRGIFKSQPETRAEFLALTRNTE